VLVLVLNKMDQQHPTSLVLPPLHTPPLSTLEARPQAYPINPTGGRLASSFSSLFSTLESVMSSHRQSV
jgi:hypothetical protein